MDVNVNEWWRWILGLDEAQWSGDAQREFVWLHAPGPWTGWLMVLVVSVLVAGVFVMYRREATHCSRGLRRMLAGLRAGVIVMLAVVWMGPAVGVYQRQVIEPVILVLVDDSASMSVKDRYVVKEGDEAGLMLVSSAKGVSAEGGASRLIARREVVQGLLSGEKGLVEQLAEHGRVQVRLFADRLGVVGGLGDEKETGTTRGGQGVNNAEGKGGLRGEEETGPKGHGVNGLEMRAEGVATDVAGAVREAMREAGGGPVAAVVLVSDGQVTAGDDPRNVARQLGGRLGGRSGVGSENEGKKGMGVGVPMLVVGVGDAEQARRVRVAEVWARETVWRGDPFTVDAQLVMSGDEAQTVIAELWKQSADEPEQAARKVATETVQAIGGVTEAGGDVRGGGQGARQVNVSFRVSAEQAGRFKYWVKLPSVSGSEGGEELMGDDAGGAESMGATVEVVEEAAKVLLVAGGPGWDFQAVKNLWLRDRSVQLSVWLQSLAGALPQEGTLRIEKLPSTMEELFAYDLVVLMDPMFSATASGDGRAIDGEWLELLGKWVGEQGGGLLFAAGPMYTGKWIQQPGAQGLRAMLPVSFAMEQALDLEGLVRPATRPWPMRFTADAADHPVLRLASTGGGDVGSEGGVSGSEGRRRGIEGAAGLYWSFPAQAVRPGARGLIEHSDPAVRGSEGQRPILAAGQYGPGRTLYLGIDSTWRWRSLGHDSEYFDRFWMQCLRYLVEGRRLTGARRGNITLSAERFSVGANVTITARLMDAMYAPMREPTVKAMLQAAGSEPVEVVMRAVEGREGQYEANVTLRRLGVHRLVIDLGTDARGQTVEVSRQLTVEPSRVEFVDIRMNRDLLSDVAKLSGGRFFEVNEVGEVAGYVPERRQVRMIAGRPVALWDGWWTVLVLVTLLAVEWMVRKRQRML